MRERGGGERGDVAPRHPDYVELPRRNVTALSAAEAKRVGTVAVLHRFDLLAVVGVALGEVVSLVETATDGRLVGRRRLRTRQSLQLSRGEPEAPEARGLRLLDLPPLLERTSSMARISSRPSTLNTTFSLKINII